MNGCKKCPAYAKCTETYRGSGCAALRYTYGLESDPKLDCTDREKLIELLHSICENHAPCSMEVVADHLLANGVTFAKDTNVPSKWISVEDALPEDSDTRVLVYINSTRSYTTLDTDRFNHLKGAWVRWGKEVTHWMPLPVPPKEA